MEITKRDMVVGAAAAVGAGLVVGEAVAAQPHMDNAIDYLRRAKAELEAASHNKGGHRNKAIELINEALNQVRLGKQAANA